MMSQAGQQEMERYATGQRLGECLVRGCVALTGTIQSLGRPVQEAGEPDAQRAVMSRTVELKVQQWLYRQPGASEAGQAGIETVRLVHAARPAMTKTATGPWEAWEGASLAVGGPLLVLRWSGTAPRPSWQGQPEDVALAVSDQALFGPIGEAIAQHRRLQADPGAIATAPRWLGERNDALFAGYLLSALMEGEGVRDVDRAAAALAGLFGHAAVPGPARSQVGDWLASSFYRLSAATRKSVTEALVICAAADQAGAADAALAVLARLGELKSLDLKPALTPERQRKLVANYRAFQSRSMARPAYPEFESQLGLR